MLLNANNKFLCIEVMRHVILPYKKDLTLHVVQSTTINTIT